MNTQNQLSDFIGLYKFYWELVLKLSIFIVGSSGAVSAYVIKNQNIEIMGFALLIPIAMCIFGTWLAHTRLPGLEIMRDEAMRLSVELGQKSYAEFSSLVIFTSALRILLLMCSIGMVILWGYIQCGS